VTRTTSVKFVPDVDEIAFTLEVHGDISSRSVTAAGPVSLTSRGNSNFVVQKPVKLSAGIALRPRHRCGIQSIPPRWHPDQLRLRAGDAVARQADREEPA